MSELKPCPFCGGKAKIKASVTTLGAKARCDKCNVEMRKNYKGNKRIENILMELIAEDWNRRVNNE
jgi:hypothetical protein